MMVRGSMFASIIRLMAVWRRVCMTTSLLRPVSQTAALKPVRIFWSGLPVRQLMKT